MYNHSEFIRPFIFSVKKRCFSILSSHGRIMIHGFVESRHLCECQISIGPVIAPKNTSQILTVQLNEINLVVKSALRDLDVARIVVCSFPMHPRFFWGSKSPLKSNFLLLQITSLHAQPASHVIEKPGDDLSTAFGADEFLQCHVAAPATCRFWAEVMWVINGYYWLVVWNVFFSICWECHHPN